MSINVILGTGTKLELVSQTHGAIRVPLNQAFDYTPRFTSKVIFEFDRTDAALTVSLFEGADIRFEYLDTESKLVDAAVNDYDPASSVGLDDPSNYKEIQIFMNIKGNDSGKIIQSVLAKGIRVKGSATTEPVRDESRITREGDALNVLRIKGGAIEYSRVKTTASTAFAQGNANSEVDEVSDEITTPGSSIFTLDNAPQTINGKRYLIALLNGTDILDLDSPPTVAFSGTGNKTVTITPALTNTDVFELFSVYIPS